MPYDRHPHFSGMMLRDYLAGQAIIGLLSQTKTTVDNFGYVFPSEKEPLCTAAYKFADAMMAAREVTAQSTEKEGSR